MRRLLLACTLLMAMVGLTPATATAAGGYCSGSGVDVVVDYGALGGGAVKSCGHGSTAAAAFESAGFSLGYNPRMGTGFVCTVDNKPADGNCAQTNSYWGLFIAKAGGGWTYASLGADSQPVSDGQTVSFAWQSSASRRYPGVAPAAQAPSAPKAKPTHAATHAAKPAPAKTSTAVPSATASASASASPSAAASARAKARHHAVASPSAPAPSASPDVSANADTVKAAAQKTDSGGGLPWWIPAGVVVLLAGGGGGAAMWLRRSRGVS